MRTLSLFEEDRLTLPKSIELSAESLCHYGSFYKHWAIAFSGGKDSSATVTLVAHLIETGKIPKPESLTILYADTRQELPPLHTSALGILNALRDRLEPILGKDGFQTRIVLPELNHRYFVYMLGRGVPPPSNTFRWCTPKLKVMNMERELETLRQERGEKFLMLTGVRIGESAARDQRIAVSCTKDGGECGQGWFQHSSSSAVADILAPIVHWRVCHVWDWLLRADLELGFPTFEIARIYGQDVSDGEEPLNARTGCIGCPLVQEDAALDRLVAQPEWAYLAPLQKLRSLYWEVKKPQHRHRKHGEVNKNGSMSAKQNRLGPLTIEARQWMLEQVLAIEEAVNQEATAQSRPTISLINDEELARIRELIADRTYPEKWDGTEPRGDEWLPEILPDGSIQPLLFEKLSVSNQEKPMEKLTIAQAAIQILQAKKQPMTSAEITQAIIDKKLYGFSSKDPKGIVRGAIERRCEGLDRKDAIAPKYFRKRSDGKYELLS
ncbi:MULTISPECIES: phosphoadenosine phosphosulfate reductase family protein [Leptolyngbya]|uniref:phosphoadenosine phosphosulfate reductase domain-containing protein n=1 Tax=Leptolyngbya TaxID=47251 RepID=UPI0016884330|nr:phosphoadenosine phosphosulfate reductase family protein [Leptolyngbya sp. FACHB-1624]MBD1859700.1 phosphoadenosine phosphosulfate reductase family protein [Leptolyngbya sp. FACHB-1624]